MDDSSTERHGTHLCDVLDPSPAELRQLAESKEARCSELEVRNEELRKVQQQLERYRDRYVDLYDFAPLGYVTLDEDGFVQEINRAGAQMLATDNDLLIGYP